VILLGLWAVAADGVKLTSLPHIGSKANTRSWDLITNIAACFSYPPKATIDPVAKYGTQGWQTIPFLVDPGRRRTGRALPVQHFLSIVEWGATVHQACEAPDITSGQMQSTFGTHVATPGDLRVDSRTPLDVIKALEGMAYKVLATQRNSGPMNAIFFDWKHGGFWAGSSNNGEDYGIIW
jgi:hypothetical protein